MKLILNLQRILTFSFFCIFLSGCFFESITSNLDICEECKGYPITTSDGNSLYRGSRTSSTSAATPRYLQQIDSSGNITVVAGSGTTAVTDGVGTAASFKEINAIAIHPGTPTYLYVADENTIRKVNTTTWQVTTIAGIAGNSSDINGTGTGATFNSAKDMVIVGNDLYIATQTTIRKMDLTTLVVTTFAGTNNNNGYTDAVGTSALFWHITGLTLAGGNLYALETTNQRIRKIDLTTAAVSTVAGNGSDQILDGVGTAASIGSGAYNKITSDGDDILFFTDKSTVRKFRISTGQVSTIVGINPNDTDGLIGSEARAFYPMGIVYSVKGLYISNHYGVRKLY